VFDNVHDASLHGLSLQGNPAGESVLRFTRVQDVLIASAGDLTGGSIPTVGGDQIPDHAERAAT